MRNLLIPAAMLVVLACFSCSRKGPDPNDVYRDVPDRDREALRNAVTQMVDFQVSKQWDEMYKVLVEPRQERDSFLRQRPQLRSLKGFRATSVTWIPDGWLVSGCGEWEPRANQPEALVSSLQAKSTDSGWRLSPVAADVFADEPGNVKRCSPPAR